MSCFSHHYQESFANVDHWIQDIEKFASTNVRKLLVGTKCDLLDGKAVDFETAKVSSQPIDKLVHKLNNILYHIQKYADQMEVPFLEASAKDNMNVEQIFITMASEIKKCLMG